MKTLLFLIPVLVFATMINAAAGPDIVPNYYHGFPYPIDGFEHVVAMIAAGILATRYRGGRQWALPATFVLMVAVGLAVGMNLNIVPLQQTELIVLVSAMLGILLVISGQRVPLVFAIPLFGFLAFFHGYAHAIHMPSDANAVRFNREIVTATAILNLAGLALGGAIRHFSNRQPALAPEAEAGMSSAG